MIRKLNLIFCDNDHGSGDVTFPDLYKLDGFEIGQEAIKELPLAEVRREAKKQGWGRVNGGDYCPSCMEGM